MDLFAQIFIAGLIGATQPATPVSINAVEFTCTDPVWVGSHELDDDAIYSGTLGSECSTALPAGAKITKLKESLIATALQDPNTTVNEGPFSEEFEGLPSTRYDVSVYLPNDGNPMTIRTDAHYASDDKARLVYASDSKKIDASGMASYMRKLAESTDVALGTDKVTFKVSSTIVVKKPWYAPTGTFLNQVESTFVSNFTKERDLRIPDWTGRL